VVPRARQKLEGGAGVDRRARAVRVGDKILVVRKYATIDPGGFSVWRYELEAARVTNYSFDHGKRRINYRLCREEKIGGGVDPMLRCRDEGLSWCRGWDTESLAAAALRVALAL
jgi:hypothetical protein